MIIYDRFWNLIKEKGITQYSLITNHGIGKEQIHRLKHNKNLNMKTIDKLCNVLDCSITDIMEYIPDEKEK